MKKKFSRKLFAVLIAVCMMVLCIPVTSQAAIRVSAPRLKSAQNTSSGISLNWTRVSNASGYVIYRNNKYIAGVKGNKSLTYRDKKAKAGARYTYSVKAFRQYGKKRIYSKASNRLNCVRRAVSNNGLKAPVQTGVRFWKNLSATGANGVTYGTTWTKSEELTDIRYRSVDMNMEMILTYSKFTKRQNLVKFFFFCKNRNENKSLQLVGKKKVYGPFSKWSFSKVY